ncbi:MAG: hypothetical protein KIG30_04390, partial [Eubacteriales bacterium]|nr:hypothetical protein [Eubacteriales bacterium]
NSKKATDAQEYMYKLRDTGFTYHRSSVSGSVATIRFFGISFGNIRLISGSFDCHLLIAIFS